MKKLLKSEIRGSMNSAQIHCSLRKVNICGYCSLNSSRIPPKTHENKKKKKKERKEQKHSYSQTQTQLKCYPN